MGGIPFLFPVGPPLWVSMELAGLEDDTDDVNSSRLHIAVWGRLPGPTLLEKELPEVLREDTDGVLDDTDEENDVILDAPASVVGLTDELAGRGLESPIALAGVSPARSASVLRLGVGSGTMTTQLTFIVVNCYLRAEPLFFIVIALGGGIMVVDRALVAEAEISERPLAGEGILLGCRRWEVN